MPAVFKKQTIISQPPASALIDWGLIGADAFVYRGDLPSVLKFSSQTVVGSEPGNNGSASNGQFGIARVFSGVSTANAGTDFGTLQPFLSNSAITMLIVAQPSTVLRYVVSQRRAANAYLIGVAFNGVDISGSTTSGAIGLLTNGSSGLSRVTASNQIDGSTHVWVLSNSATQGYIYRDGIKQALSNDSRLTGTYLDAAQKFKIGASADSSGTSGCQYPVYLIVGWPRQVDEALAAKLSINPWQIFSPTRRIIAFDYEPISGVATSTATATGSITSDVAMSAASAVIASATGAVSQSIELLGSAAAVSISDGVATVTTTLAGDGFVETMASGALASALAIESAAVSSASAVGILDLSSDLSGEASAQASSAGTVGLSVSISANALAQALASADLVTGDGLAGGATANATANAALTQSVDVLGDATVTVIGSGGMTITQSLAAEAVVSAIAGGDLVLNLVGLSASAIAQALAGGSIGISMDLSADALAKAMAPSSLMTGAMWSGLLLEKYTVTTTERNYAVEHERNYTVEALA